MCKIRPIQRVPGAVVSGQDRVIFHPDRGNVHFRMRKGGEEEQWRKWHARPHRRTDGPAGNCIARIGRNCASVYLPRSLAAFSVRSSVVPRPRVRAPMSSFLCPLTIVNRRPPVPAYPAAHPSLSLLLLHPFADASRFRERREACSRRTGRK